MVRSCRWMCAFLAGVLGASSVAAQTPPDLSDMVGSRAGQAEGELQRRGYRATDRSEVVGDGRLTYWQRGDQCVAIMTRDGRYQSINRAGRDECRSGSSSSGSAAAVAAGVALVGLAAALASHNRRRGETTEDHDREYERGYQAALYGADYDDRHETEGYHEGYLAGEHEASNRRHSNSRWVRGVPDAAQEACSRRADDFQNQPAGSSVPIGQRALGRGEYELTMATGPYRSVCRVNESGMVRSMDPYY